MRTGILVAGLGLLFCFAGLAGFFLIASRSGETVVPGVAPAAPEASFEVRVVKPRSARPLFGLVPTGALRFDHKSLGAAVGQVGPGRLELAAEGWNLRIEAGEEGEIAATTQLLFELSLGGKDQKLRCKPALPAEGYFQSVVQGTPGEFGGNFEIELATCENAASGYVINWPPAPLTVSGNFNRLSSNRPITSRGSQGEVSGAHETRIRSGD